MIERFIFRVLVISALLFVNVQADSHLKNMKVDQTLQQASKLFDKGRGDLAYKKLEPFILDHPMVKNFLSENPDVIDCAIKTFSPVSLQSEYRQLEYDDKRIIARFNERLKIYKSIATETQYARAFNKTKQFLNQLNDPEK
jgi:hypothetical protein